MKDTSSKILSNHHISGSFWRMRLETGWQDYVPGQFVMFQVPGDKVFLRRPFGIARMKNGVVEICYKVIGAGTEVMSALKVGDEVNVLGPLGNGFQIPNVVAKLALPIEGASAGGGSAFGGSSATTVVAKLALPKSGGAPRHAAGSSSATTLNLLVAGGYGVAPLLGLAEKLGNGVHLFYGAKTKSELLYLDEFKELGVELHIATEDGSMGEKGLVTDLNSIFKPDPKICKIFACGPKGMLRSVAQDFSPANIGRAKAPRYIIGRAKAPRYNRELDCQLSLESYMGCGYGVCMGCAVKLKNGEYARVCKDGPVFDAKQLDM